MWASQGVEPAHEVEKVSDARRRRCSQSQADVFLAAREGVACGTELLGAPFPTKMSTWA